MWWRVVSTVMLLISVQPACAEDGSISLREWKALTSGKTIYYHLNGTYQGKEYYLPDDAFLVFMTPDGQCVEGVWAYADGRYCFSYGANFQCFDHLRRGSRLFSRADTGGPEQEIKRIVDEPLSCSPG